MSQNQQVILNITPEKHRIYAEADRVIHERLGHSPGPEFLMSLILEIEESATDLADIYCHTVLQQMPA